MFRFTWQLSLIGLCLLLSMPNPRLFAQANPDIYVDSQFALTTSKSKLVNSNDTGSAFRYGLGTFAGSRGNLGFLLHYDRDITSFALNASKVDMNWQDTRVQYYLSYFYLGVLFTRLDMKVNRQELEIIDAAGSGLGLSLGSFIPIGRNGSVSFDIRSASLSEMKNALANEIAVKQRLDIDINGSVALTSKMFDLTFGYRIRQLSVTTDANYAESLSATYLGLRMSFFL